MVTLKTATGKLILIISISIIILSVVIGVVWWQKSQAPELPANIETQLKSTAFLPHKLPENYRVDEASYTMNSETFIFKITAPQDTTILMSQQPEPGNFDIGEFHNVLKDKQTIDTPYGTAYVGKSENTKVGSLVTSGSWVFLSAPPSTDSEILKIILQHLSETE